MCRRYEKFGHLAQNCRREEEWKKKIGRGNKFEVLKSHVMQCGVKKVRRQEVVEEKP